MFDLSLKIETIILRFVDQLLVHKKLHDSHSKLWYPMQKLEGYVLEFAKRLWRLSPRHRPMNLVLLGDFSSVETKKAALIVILQPPDV